MADFSVPPESELARNRDKGYTGLHFEQGVPILDRDLNLLQDLITASVRSVVTRFIGNGVAADSSAFAVEPVGSGAADDVLIRAGKDGARSCLVDGIEVSLPADVRYSEQVPPPPQEERLIPATGSPRTDTVYLDVVVRTVENTVELSNAGDVGVQTTVRLQPVVRIRVARGVAGLPPPEEGHHRYELARIVRGPGAALIDAAAITDLRQTRVNLAEVAARMEAVEDLRVRPHFDPADPFTPPGARVNEEITLHGRNFDVLPVTVRFGTRDVTVPREAVTPTSVRVKVPPNTPDGPVTVGVTTGGGTAVAARQFEVNGDLPEPVVTDFVPLSGQAGDPVTIHGRNFNVGGLEVTFGDRRVDGPRPNADGTAIEARVPGELQGAVPVKVTTAGGGPATIPTLFTIGRAPAFGAVGQQFSPRQQIPTGTVHVQGAGLSGVRTVTFVRITPPATAVPAANVTVLSDTRLDVQVPDSLVNGTRHRIRLHGDIGADATSDDILTVGTA
jgi:hypothetical protein